MRAPVRTAISLTTAALLALAAAPAIHLSTPTPAGSAVDGPDGEDPHVASSNMSWVANVQYPVTDNNSQEGTTDVQGGTDLELVTLAADHDGDGVSTDRDYAMSGTYENGFQVVDVTDPTAPFIAATYDCDVYQGDVQVWTHDARTFVTYGVDYSAESDSDCFTDLQGTPGQMAAMEGGHLGALVIEVTDPLAPRSVGFVPAQGGTHNGTVRGFDTDGDGTQDKVFFYNSENDTAGSLQVWDVTDVTDPTNTATLALQDAGADTHDVTFNADGTRAYVASINLSYVLDTTDPADPVLVSRIIDPAVGIHHQADPLTIGDSTYVIISDEIAGAAGNGFCPGGGIHVWDVTVEQAPVKVGAYFMPDVTVQEGANTGTGGLVSCTAHVFRLYPEQQIMTIGNMAGGVRVIDVSELVGVSVGDENTSTGTVAGMADLGWFRFTNGDTTGHDSWAFKAHPDRFAEDGSFHAFSNDQTRGFEVFHFDASATAAEASDGEAERGWWATPEQALERFRELDLELDDDALLYSCRFPGGLRGAVPTA